MLDQCQGFIDIGHAYMLMYHSAAFLDSSLQMAYIVCAFLQDGVIQRVMREPSKRSAERKAFLMRQEGYRARVQKEDCTVKVVLIGAGSEALHHAFETKNIARRDGWPPMSSIECRGGGRICGKLSDHIDHGWSSLHHDSAGEHRTSPHLAWHRKSSLVSDEQY